MSVKQFVIYIQGDIQEGKAQQNFAICSDFSDSNRIIQECYAFFFRLLKRLPEVLPVNSPGWEDAGHARVAIISRVRWPYGINLESEIPMFSNESNGGFLGTEMLPTIKPKQKGAR